MRSWFVNVRDTGSLARISSATDRFPVWLSVLLPLRHISHTSLIRVRKTDQTQQQRRLMETKREWRAVKQVV